MNFQKTATNLKFRFDMIVRDNFQFFFCSIANHGVTHSKTFQMIFFATKLIRLKNLSIVKNIAFISFEIFDMLTIKSMIMM